MHRGAILIINEFKPQSKTIIMQSIYPIETFKDRQNCMKIISLHISNKKWPIKIILIITDKSLTMSREMVTLILVSKKIITTTMTVNKFMSEAKLKN